MESKKTRVGIIGCGKIANSKHMKALGKVKTCEMVAFCDILPEKAEDAREKYGAEGSKTYTDYRELLKDESIDVVHVCTPNRSHAFITVDALESGKHVMCEKPMAINSEEAKKMLDAQKRTGKLLSIGYQNRFRSDSMYLKKEAEADTFGDIYFARAEALRRRAVPTWGVFLNEKEQGGGPLIDIGTHALDLTLWVMNNYKPKYCVGSVYHKLNNQTETGNKWGDWDPEKFTVEDSAFGFVVMENGATIVLESAWALNILDYREARTQVCGTKAGADMHDGLRINGVRRGVQYVLTPDLAGKGADFNEGHSTETPAETEARLWIAACRGGAVPITKPEEAYCVTRILEGIYESSKTGKPYYFDEE